MTGRSAVLDVRLASGEDISEKVAVVVAHPDDEVLALGAALVRLKRLSLIHLTDGAPRDMEDAAREGCASVEDYAAVRHHELHDALQMIGAKPASCVHMNYPDKEALRYLVPMTRWLVPALEHQEAVVTHPYEHGHPDHDAAAFVVHAACRILDLEGVQAPAIFEFASYHGRGDEMVRAQFWPDPRCAEHVATLSPVERDLKHRAIVCFASQRATLGSFPLEVERIRAAPLYDFTRAAPPDRALYESFGWQITRGEWCRRATLAQAALGLEGEL